jgi:hypothetical protein
MHRESPCHGPGVIQHPSVLESWYGDVAVCFLILSEGIDEQPAELLCISIAYSISEQLSFYFYIRPMTFAPFLLMPEIGKYGGCRVIYDDCFAALQ